MMGERVGGPGDGVREGQIQEVIIKVKRPSWFRRNISRPIENFFNGRSRNATAGSVPTFSQAPDIHTVGDLSTFGQKVQAYRDYEPDPTDLGGKIIKPIMNGALDAANYLRNVNPFADKRDYNGLAPRMTKWDGNTMGSEQGQNSSINGIMFMSSFTSLGMTAKGSGLTKVGHWCPKSSYDIMVKTGYTVPEQGGLTFFSTSGPDSWAAAPKKWVYSEMFIESKSLIDGGQPDWLKVVHPEAKPNQKAVLSKQGGQLNPPIKNLTPILKTK